MRRLIYIFLIAHNALAGVSFTHGPQQEILLVANSCSEANEALQQLQTWRQTQPAAERQSLALTPRDQDCRKIEITSILPAVVKKYFGINPARDGPNCFGLTLTTLGFNKAHRYVTSDEFMSTLKSPLCRSIRRADLVPGDVLLFMSLDLTQSRGPRPLHAAVWISDKMIWTKNGPDSDLASDWMSLKSLFESYYVAPECRNSQDSKEPSCQTWLNFYRCARASSSFTLGIDPVIERSLSEIELKLSRGAYDWKDRGFSRFEKDPEIEARLLKIQAELRQSMNVTEKKSKRWMLELLIQRAQSLIEQNRITTGIGSI